MTRYLVLHETDYDYGSPVSLSQQLLHLSPRPLGYQQCLAHELVIEPPPNWQREGWDAFGNPVHWIAFDQPHAHLHVRSRMEIEVLPHLPRAPLAASPTWESVRERLAYAANPLDEADREASCFLFESPFVRVKHEFARYAEDCFPAGTPVLEGVKALMNKIFSEFKFDPEATTVATPVLEVLANKRGVCQDFAHLMIACLRSLGLAARYVSGYLLTQPPPGKPRLIGADASHAWVSVYVPGEASSWVDFDPTNNLLPDTQHITISIGRDFGDISPLRGIILGGGNPAPEVAVTVLPVGEDGQTEISLDRRLSSAKKTSEQAGRAEEKAGG